MPRGIAVALRGIAVALRGIPAGLRDIPAMLRGIAATLRGIAAMLRALNWAVFTQNRCFLQKLGGFLDNLIEKKRVNQHGKHVGKREKHVNHHGRHVGSGKSTSV